MGNRKKPRWFRNHIVVGEEVRGVGTGSGEWHLAACSKEFGFYLRCNLYLRALSRGGAINS